MVSFFIAVLRSIISRAILGVLLGQDDVLANARAWRFLNWVRS